MVAGQGGDELHSTFRQVNPVNCARSHSERAQPANTQVVQAWVDARQRAPRTLHHRGRGLFMTAGETIKLPSGKL